MLLKLCASLVLASIVSAQTQNQRIPLENLYRAFFGHCVFLKQQATRLPLGSSEQVGILSYYENTLRLSNSEARLLQTIAEDADQKVQQLDRQAQVIIEQFRKEHPPHLASLAALPPPPPMLGQLWQQRQQMLDDHVAQLQQSMPASFPAIDAFVKSKFSMHARIKPLKAPGGVTLLHHTNVIPSTAEVAK